MANPERPNIVLVTTDQQRADATVREGFALDTTPFLDGLADDGAWFDRAYTATPVCCPARVSLLTGRFPSATRVRSNDAAASAQYTSDLFDVLDEAGYATALVGKNHSHLTPERVNHWYELSHWGAMGEASRTDRTDEDESFEEWIDNLGWSPSLEPTPFPPRCQSVARVVSEAIEWVASLEEDPFFVWLSIPEPHNPFQAPEPYFSLFSPEDLPEPRAGPDALTEKGFHWEYSRRLAERRVADRHPETDYEEVLPRIRSNYYGMLRLIDDQLERFVKALDAEGVWADTLFVCTSDHGDFTGEYGLLRKGVGTLPETTTRVPLVVHGPGVAGGDTNDSETMDDGKTMTDAEIVDTAESANSDPCSAHISLVDLLPTLCKACGADVPPGVQGRSLWQLLTDEDVPSDAFESVYAEAGVGGARYEPSDAPPPEEASINELNQVTQSGTTAMVRRGDVKLVFGDDDRRQLYDLSVDPAEMVDRSDDPEYAEVRCELLETALAWTLRIRDDLPLPDAYHLKKKRSDDRS